MSWLKTLWTRSVLHERFSFTTSLSPDETLRELAPLPGDGFKGETGIGGFQLTPRIPGLNNQFWPVMHGRFNGVTEGTRIDVRAHPHPLMGIFLLVWLMVGVSLWMTTGHLHPVTPAGIGLIYILHWVSLMFAKWHMLRKLRKLIPEAAPHVDAFRQLNAPFAEVVPEQKSQKEALLREPDTHASR